MEADVALDGVLTWYASAMAAIDDAGTPGELPARQPAVTVHRGAHDDIDVTYAALGTHLAENALTVDGPVHETHPVGPRDSDDADAWRTEIGWPVFRTAV